MKDSRRPTVNEIAGQPRILQKINGWKVHLVSTHMAEVVDIEVDLSHKLSALQKKLDKLTGKELSRDVANIQEIVKGTLQRSKIIRDQVHDSQKHAMQLFEHKDKVKEIIDRYNSKRHSKKRELRA